jgi:hypothetical protein
VTAVPPIPVVWLEAAAPDPDQSRALTGWARAHGIELVLPSNQKPPTIALDARTTMDLADEVERLLDRVRDAIAGRDGEAADGGLAAAESLLRAHPELPQASWLMAEVERGRSSRFRRVQPFDGEAAERAWARAEALDGGRVPGVGERSTTASPADATLAIDALPAEAALRLDGHLQPAGATVVATHAGPHALVVTWSDTPVWSGWIDAPPGSSALALTLPALPPCSTGDVEPAHVAGADRGAVEATGVRCASWVAARSGPRAASVRVARCEMDRCGNLVEWSAPSPESWTWSPAPERARGRWPSWATWGLVGAGAVIATGVVVVASGVLRTAPNEMRFVSGGVKAQ